MTAVAGERDRLEKRRRTEEAWTAPVRTEECQTKGNLAKIGEASYVIPY